MRALQPADPRLIGPYRLVGQLGSGGMGRVFLAMSAGGRPVAVKMIRAELAADPDFRKRFGREVAAARRVNGLFTALVVDADVDAQVPWLATAYVAGPSLAETVKDHGALSARSVLALAAGLAEGLVAIHAAGVVHGDLKPSNVLLAEDGPRVIDFGISHAAEAAPLTHPGLVMGSPGFMSPEQALGKKLGPLSDVFSLGTVIAFAATGVRPFGTGTPVVLLDRVVHGEPLLDGVPAEVLPLVRRCLAKDPSERPTAAGLLAEMGAVQATTDWLPDSIVRMIRRDLPPRGEEDRKEIAGLHSTGTVTLGSAAQSAASASVESPPAHQGQAADPATTADHAHTAERAPTGDHAPPGHRVRPDADTDVNAQAGGPSQSAGQVPAGDLLDPRGKMPRGDPAQSADPEAPDDQRGAQAQDPRLDQRAGEAEDNPRSRRWRPLAAVCVIGGLLAASGAVGIVLLEKPRHSSDASSRSQLGSSTATSPLSVGITASAPAHRSSTLPPVITGVYTYQQAEMMYFDIYYTDPGNNAAGFGFVGVNGTSLGQQNYLFSNPGDGIIEPGSITYSLTQACVTGQPRTSSVKVWVYDTAGTRSNTKTVSLSCGT
ncbi:MAG: protein kinase [Actinomycetota bacterium]|nr:protein kinase [Actinomycetota bacterium]